MDKIAYIYSTLTISKGLKIYPSIFYKSSIFYNIDNTQNIFLVVLKNNFNLSVLVLI